VPAVLLSPQTGVAAIATVSSHDLANLASAMRSSPAKMGDLHIVLESDVPQLVKRINHGTNTGKFRLLASDSIRVTKRS
jgi:hypothetical protein